MKKDVYFYDGFYYISKFLFIEEWFYIKDKIKYSKLTEGQICAILYFIEYLRGNKLYNLSDFFRNKLRDTGYFWWMSKDVNITNLLGHTENKLRIEVDKNKIHIEGFIHYKNKHIDIFYKITK